MPTLDMLMNVPVNRRLLSVAARLAVAALCGQAYADVRLPAVLSDHMVLQRAAGVPVWGWAEPGEKVTVRFAGREAAALAGVDGKWMVTLDLAAAPAEPSTMTVSTPGNTITITDVLVGEVWLASGQSNMEMHLGVEPGLKRVRDADAEIAKAGRPTIRLFKVPKKRSDRLQDDVKAQWTVSSPESIVATKFSAVAYFFGTRLQERLATPVGLIDASYGGTPIEYWQASDVERGPEAPPPDGDWSSDPLRSGMYNAMVAPLAPFALSGVLWYQGEQNVLEHQHIPAYTSKMRALITGWRSKWNAQFPVYYVQLPPHLYHVYRRSRVISTDAVPAMREAQTAALGIPDTGMVVTTDLVDDLTDIHPPEKKTVGLRLANLALNRTYGQADLPASGPVFRSMRIEGGKAVLSFDHAAGLATRDGKAPTWFDIAGTDGHYFNADAKLAGDTVVLRSKYVSAPVSVRFAWDEAAQPNLVNRDGLPGRPFRTTAPPAQDAPRP